MNPITFAVSADLDTMYHHEAMSKAAGSGQVSQGHGRRGGIPQTMGPLGHLMLSRHPTRHQGTSCCLVNETEAVNHYKRDLQMESPAQCPWQQTGEGHPLLGDIFSSGKVVFYTVLSVTLTTVLLAHLTD